MNVVDIKLKFPHLDEPNVNNIQFDLTTRGWLDTTINGNRDAVIPVTLYQSLDEYKYATGSSLRYGTTDPLFKVGEVTAFDGSNDMMTLRVKDEVADMINSGTVLPRAYVKITSRKNKTTQWCTINRLISIDILNMDSCREQEEE